MEQYRVCPRCNYKNYLYNGEDEIKECYFCGYPFNDLEDEDDEE